MTDAPEGVHATPNVALRTINAGDASGDAKNDASGMPMTKIFCNFDIDISIQYSTFDIRSTTRRAFS